MFIGIEQKFQKLLVIRVAFLFEMTRDMLSKMAECFMRKR